MARGVLGGHGLERPGANRERQVRDRDAARADRLQDLLGEVQPRGGRGDCERLAREDGLVRRAVLGPVGRAGLAADVRREGGPADPLEQREIERPVERHGALSALGIDRLDARREVVLEANRAPGLRAPSRLRQGSPAPGVRRVGTLRPEQEDLDEAALGVPAVEPRRTDPHVVTDEKVALAEQLREIGESAVRDRAVLARHHEEPAPAAGPRLLRDPIDRQLVVEERDAHV